ncbi:MAG: helix-turn-helix domain-containing protein [Lachnospiraceae bacterium]|nr:helix-turn-helix domain-containing protein [Lachnospiraceae bacterium]
MKDEEKEKNQKVADNICAYRKANRLTQEGLAILLGVSPATISRYESNESAPTSIELIAMASIFNIDVADLFNENVTYDDLHTDRHIYKCVQFLINYVTELSLTQKFFPNEDLQFIQRLGHYEKLFDRQS